MRFLIGWWMSPAADIYLHEHEKNEGGPGVTSVRSNPSTYLKALGAERARQTRWTYARVDQCSHLICVDNTIHLCRNASRCALEAECGAFSCAVWTRETITVSLDPGSGSGVLDVSIWRPAAAFLHMTEARRRQQQHHRIARRVALRTVRRAARQLDTEDLDTCALAPFGSSG